MSVTDSYVEYVKDQLGQIVDVTSRKMFGGAGIYTGGAMFALISSDDVLHLKVDDSNRGDYENAGMTQFKPMPYWQLPDDVLEDFEELTLWANKAIDAAQKSKK